MKKILFGLCIIFSCVSVYAGALDDLMVEKQAEKAKAAERSAQQKQAKQQQLADIADCEQAVEKALEKRKQISTEHFCADTTIKVPWVEGIVVTHYPCGVVKDFASDGIFVDDKDGHRIFIYTNDTDYATNEKFNTNGLVYARVGNYKYTTITGATNSVPAYKATNYKASELDLRTYLNNKTLRCCEEKDEIGIYTESRCKTKNSKSGYYGGITL